MTPDEFVRMVQGIRAIEHDARAQAKMVADHAMHTYFGQEDKILQEGEAPFRAIFRKALVVARDIPAGSVLAASDVFAMRPRELIGGLGSERFELVIGKTIGRDMKKFDPVTFDVL